MSQSSKRSFDCVDGGNNEDNDDPKRRSSNEGGNTHDFRPITPHEGSSTPTSKNNKTVAQFYIDNERTPPMGSEIIRMDSVLLSNKAQLILGCDFDECDSMDKQLRFLFILMKGYDKILNEENLWSLASPYRQVLEYNGFKSPIDAMKKSLSDATECGKRLGQLIQKGGDIIVVEKELYDVSNSCIKTYDEFVERNPVWQNSSTSIFRERRETIAAAEGGLQQRHRRVEPFLMLQTGTSDLCYIVQASTGIYYHLQMRPLL